MIVNLNDAINLISTKNKKEGIFIVFEGVNGSGKSTLLNHFADTIKPLNKKVTVTKEPGATALGKEIRRIVLEKRAESIEPIAELLLFAADRYQHIYKLIKPALSQGEIVLCDRFHYSTTAFQGGGRQTDLKIINTLNEIACPDLKPDLVLLIDLDAELGLKRTKIRNQLNNTPCAESDRFEIEELNFHVRVRESYLDIALKDSQPILIVDGSKSPNEIQGSLAPLIRALSAV